MQIRFFQFIILFFILFIISSTTQAQWLHDLNFFNHDRDTLPALRFDFDYAVASDGITNKFINSYVSNKFLNKDLKDKTSDKLKSNNHIGSNLDAGLAYRSKAFHKHWKDQPILFQWTAAFKNRVLFDASFSKNLFRLYFYGNKIYEDQTADIKNFNYTFRQFQQLQIGSIKTAVREGITITSLVAVSYLNGQDYLSIKTDRGKLYTATDAEYVDLDLALTSRQADSSSRKFGAMNGTGASLDLGFKLDTKKWKWSLQLSDLGFITWNNKSSKLVVDTNYYFEGVEVQNILDSVYIEIKSDQDFKNGFLTNRTYQKFTDKLPSQILLSIETSSFGSKIHAYATVRYRFNTEMPLPHILMGADYLFSKSIYAGVIMQYGGYSKFHAGIRAGLDSRKGWMLYAGTSYLDGWVMQNNAGGVGGSLGLQKVF